MNNIWYFYIDGEGNYHLNVNKHQNIVRTICEGFSPAIKTGLNRPNLIAVVAQRTNFDLYVNMQLLAHASDATFSAGQIGMIAIPVRSSTEAVFNNAKVWKL